MEHDCCRQENKGNHQEGKEGRQSNGQAGKELSNTLLVIGALLMGAIIVQAYSFTQIGETNALLEKQATTLSLGGNPNPAPVTGNGQSVGAIDMSGWTDNEKMNYEMHGIMPARAQGGSTAQNAAPVTANFSEVLPKGTPRIYGQELGVGYGDVSVNDQQKANATIAILSQFDQEKGGKFIELSGDAQQRYIKIASQISCEYCCGAESIIFPNGKAACGCAHSYSMRGLAKYLLKNHPNDFTDDQILEELGKWKTLFFPGILAEKAKALKDKGIEFNYINLASNKYRGLEKGAQGGSMVGGC